MDRGVFGGRAIAVMTSERAAGELPFSNQYDSPNGRAEAGIRAKERAADKLVCGHGLQVKLEVYASCELQFAGIVCLRRDRAIVRE